MRCSGVTPFKGSSGSRGGAGNRNDGFAIKTTPRSDVTPTAASSRVYGSLSRIQAKRPVRDGLDQHLARSAKKGSSELPTSTGDKKLIVVASESDRY